MAFDYDKYGDAFLAMHLHRLRVLITAQCDKLNEGRGIVTPSACTSTLMFLGEHESASLSELAEELGYSHQLTNQRVVLLTRLKLVRRVTDARDRRKVRVTLTALGAEEVEKIHGVVRDSAVVFSKLFDEIGFNVRDALIRAEQLLGERSIAARAQEVDAARAKRTRKRAAG
jgi:DNA-binding MarR family transcriptional regulator